MKNWFKALIIKRLYIVALLAFSCQGITEGLVGTFDDDTAINQLPQDYMYTLSLEEIMNISISNP